MLGLRSRPSSRSLKEAIDLLNAVDGDKSKAKILEEIKQAQDQYEAVVAKANEERRAAEKAKAEAAATIERERAALAEFEKTQRAAAKENADEVRKLLRLKDELAAREQALKTTKHDLDMEVKRENAALDKKRTALGDVERAKRQAESLMAEAQALKDAYRSKLARLADIAAEEL